MKLEQIIQMLYPIRLNAGKFKFNSWWCWKQTSLRKMIITIILLEIIWLRQTQGILEVVNIKHHEHVAWAVHVLWKLRNFLTRAPFVGVDIRDSGNLHFLPLFVKTVITCFARNDWNFTTDVSPFESPQRDDTDTWHLIASTYLFEQHATNNVTETQSSGSQPGARERWTRIPQVIASSYILGPVNNILGKAGVQLGENAFSHLFHSNLTWRCMFLLIFPLCRCRRCTNE